MKPKLYRPTPVFLPGELVKNNQQVQQQLLDYMFDYCYPPGAQAPLRFASVPMLREDGSRIKDISEIKQLTRQEKLDLLEHPVPLFYDVLIVGGKLLAIGTYLPGMDEIIGLPKLQLQQKNSGQAIEVDYYKEDLDPHLKRKITIKGLGAQRYLVVEDLPPELLDNPAAWQLNFCFAEFEQSCSLQPNPFSHSRAKKTLMTLQKNNPPEWLDEWCNYYHKQHGVERIIIYNNLTTEPTDLPDFSANKDLELYYVEWQHLYQQYFISCQISALNHCHWWAGGAASYILNFDIDEYLVNASGYVLEDYLQRKYPQGIRVCGYEMPAEIEPQQEQEYSLIQQGRHQNRSITKYVFAPNHWHIIHVHFAGRFTFWRDPPFWRLLLGKRPKLRAAKFLYNLARKLPPGQKVLAKMRRAPVEDLVFLHYRSRNSHWKWGKGYFQHHVKAQSK